MNVPDWMWLSGIALVAIPLLVRRAFRAGSASLHVEPVSRQWLIERQTSLED